jgi:hypothetical protein
MLNLAALEESRREYKRLRSEPNERERRLWAAGKAEELGRGNISTIAEIVGRSRTTIYAGLAELKHPPAEEFKDDSRVRKRGGGRKRVTARDPKLVTALESLLEPRPGARKSGASLLRWTSKDTQRLAKDLKKKGHVACPRSIGNLLRGLGYRLHHGRPQSDRDEQFDYLNRQARAFQRQGLPVVMVETRQRIDGSTAQPVAESVLRWWQDIGRRRFRRARKMLIVADFTTQRAGAWKLALQRVADHTGLNFTICKLPVGTSRWTKIEKQLVCRWASNGGDPSGQDQHVEVSLVGTAGSNGEVPSSKVIGPRRHTNGKVTRAAVAGVKLKPHKFQGDWNFTIGAG